MHPETTILGADSAYAGQLDTWAKTHLKLTIKTVSRPKDAPGFIVLPRRTHAGMAHAQHSEALITWAAITRMTRRLAASETNRIFRLEHGEYDSERIDGFDYDIGAALIASAEATSESGLVTVLTDWQLSPRQFVYPGDSQNSRALRRHRA